MFCPSSIVSWMGGHPSIHHKPVLIYYDMIEDGQNKTSNCLFSFLVKNCVIFAFYMIYFEIILLPHHSIQCHFHNNTALTKKCFNPGWFAFTACSSHCVLLLCHVSVPCELKNWKFSTHFYTMALLITMHWWWCR